MRTPEQTSPLDLGSVFDRDLPVVGERTLEILRARRSRKGKRTRSWLVLRTLVIADVLGLVVAFVLAELVFGRVTSSRTGVIDPVVETLLFLATLPGWIVVAKLYRLYDRDGERTDHGTSDDLVSVFHLVTVGSWLFLAAAWSSRFATPSLPKLFTFWALAIVLVSAGRGVGRTFCRSRMEYMQNVIVVGAGDVGQQVASKFLRGPEYGVNVVGFVDSAPPERRAPVANLPLLGDLDDLGSLVTRYDVDRVIVAFSWARHEELLELVRELGELGVQVDIVPRLFDVLSTGAAVHSVQGIPLVGLPPFRLSRSSRLLKRTMDVALSAAGLVLLSPLLVMIALLIKLDSRGPVLFRQVRMGSSRPFTILKFRTMTVDADDEKGSVAHLNVHTGEDSRMFKIEVDPRVTRVGSFLRRTSLDELPQLVNVLRDEMSLVGPRPLILDEHQHVAGWARKRLDLKPGMTGLWQVLGRSEIPFEEMVKLDYVYVTTWSLWGDFLLLLRTLPHVFRGNRGAY